MKRSLWALLAAVGLVAWRPVVSTATSAATAAPLTVVAEFYPLYVALQNVTAGADGVSVANLVPPTTGCPEDYQLTPGDLKLLNQADVFVVNGAGLEGYLRKLAAQCPRLKVVDASAGLDLLKVDGEINPHLWVSPVLAARQVRTIAAALAVADPVRAALYQKNAGDYAARLEVLGRNLRASLAAAPVRRILAFHDSLPYLARDLNLEIIASIEPAPGQNPGARELANVIQKVRAAPGPVALISEIDAKNPAAEVVSRELGQPLYSLDTVTSGPMAPAEARNAYLRAMEKNQLVLRQALGLPDASPDVRPEK